MPDSNIIKFYPKDAAKDPDAVLSQAIGTYQDVLIIGYDHEGNLQVCASDHFADGGNLLWAIETFKAELINGEYEE